MIPLESVSYEVEVDGPLAEVVVRQTFLNASSRFVDATYTFPLAPDAVIDRMDLKIGSIEIHSAVQARDEARATYEAAADAGHVAALLGERAGSVYAQEVANVPPWSTVEIVLAAVWPVRRVGGGWELDLPLATAPRMEASDLLSATVDPLRDRLGVPVDVSVSVHAGADLVALASPSHLVDAAFDGHDGTALAWGAETDRDLVLRWATAPAEEPALTLLVGGEQALLEIAPPELAFADRLPRDLVWVADPSLDAAEVRRVQGFADPWPDELVRTVPAIEDALALPPDRWRHRTIAYVGRGAFPDVASTLRAVAAHPDVTVVALGVEAADRTTLGELARLGGGAAAFVPEDYAAALARPLLTDLRVDWAGCPADQPAPERFPDVRLGAPERILVHVTRCHGPVWVSAISNGRRAEWPVWPEYVGDGRPLAVAWARARVEELQRRALRGIPGDVRDEVREIGLRWGIVTSETSMVAVDPRVVNVTGERATVITDAVTGTFSVNFNYDAVTETVAGERAQILVDELTRMGGILPRPWHLLMDGHETADPLDPWLRAPVPDAALRDGWILGTLPFASVPDATSLQEVHLDSGGNNLDWRAAAGGLLAGGDVSAHAVATGAGPLWKDHVFFRGTDVFHRFALDGLDVERDVGVAALSAQLTTAHRIELEGTIDRGAAGAGAWGGELGLARWRYFPALTVAIDTSASLQRRELAGSVRDRWQVGSALRWSSIGDPLGGEHELEAGVAGSGWTAPGLRQGGLAAFAQDAWAPLDHLTVRPGSRLSVVGGTAYASPRLAASWDPTGDGRSKVAAGVDHLVDADRLAFAGAPTVRDMASVGLEREVVADTALFVWADLHREELPFAPSPDLAPGATAPFPRVERRVAAVTAGLRKVESHRWGLEASGTWNHPFDPADPDLLLDPGAPWTPGFLDPYRRWAAAGDASWQLPTDPWDQTISLAGSWRGGIADGPWWLRQAGTLRAAIDQDLAIRKGTGTISLEVVRSWNAVESTVLPLEVLALVPGAPDPGAQSGWRFGAEVAWRF